MSSVVPNEGGLVMKIDVNKAGKLALIAAVLAAGVAITPLSEAKPGNGHGNGQGNGHGHNKVAVRESSYWRNDEQRDRFRDWLGRYTDSYGSSNVPTSVLRRNRITRAEFEALPPGIQKNVLRGKSIPPGLQPGHRLNRTELGRVSPISDRILDSLGIPTERYRYKDGRRVGRYQDNAIIYSPVSGISLTSSATSSKPL